MRRRRSVVTRFVPLHILKSNTKFTRRRWNAFTATHCRSKIRDRSCRAAEWRCHVGKPGCWRTIFTSFLVLAATTVAAPAQTYKTLVSFNGTDGVYPMYAPLVQGRDRNFYGTTRGAGGNNPGTVFNVTAGDTLTTLAVLATQPYSGLVLATDGSFYGTTALGGANGWGTIFKMTSMGTLTPLYSFCAQTNCSDGVFPLFGWFKPATVSCMRTDSQRGRGGQPRHDLRNHPRR